MNKEEYNGIITADIKKAIGTMESQEQQGQGKEVEEVAPESQKEVQEETPASKDFVADDALIERAVKAGLSIADAKLFKSSDQADRILTALESKDPANVEKAKTEQENNGGEGFPAAEFDSAIKEMEEDGDYDPKFISLFKQMGSLLKVQSDELKALKAAGKSATVQSSFDRSFGGLDEGVRSHIDAATKSKLKSKFDFLKSAHESAKDKATDEEIFDEAKKLVLGDIVQNAEEENKAKLLEQRKSLLLARPGGEQGTRGARPVTEGDIVDALFEKLTK